MDKPTDKPLFAETETAPGQPPAYDNLDLRRTLAEDPELIGLSLYEKKAALVNRELDSHGMGRYQWCIWGLCGFG